jgi:hypothetical protein
MKLAGIANCITPSYGKGGRKMVKEKYSMEQEANGKVKDSVK